MVSIAYWYKSLQWRGNYLFPSSFILFHQNIIIIWWLFSKEHTQIGRMVFYILVNTKSWYSITSLQYFCFSSGNGWFSYNFLLETASTKIVEYSSCAWEFYGLSHQLIKSLTHYDIDLGGIRKLYIQDFLDVT